jgi:hypothetical protein
MPKMRVFRPADAVETAECWQLALERRDGPSVLALTRQTLPQVRREAEGGNRSAAGAYELSPARGKARATIFASGSEVEIALAAQKILQGPLPPLRHHPRGGRGADPQDAQHVRPRLAKPRNAHHVRRTASSVSRESAQ